MDDPLRVQDRDFLALLWVAKLDAHEETVELGLGQRERALVFDRILGRHHQERLGKLVRRAVDGHLMLVHRLEQGGLRLWRRAVDLVGEDHLAHDRPRPELERVRPLIEDRDAGDVRWEQVRRELDPPERAPERSGERLRQHGLAGPWDVLDEDVAAAEKRYEGELDLVVLTEDDPLDVLDHAADPRRESFLHGA